MIIIGLILVILSGIADAAMDTLVHHYHVSIFSRLNRNFWDADISWVNKYKDGDKRNGEKFFGSTTFLVWTTDAWHLFKTVRSTTLWIGAVTIGLSYKIDTLNFWGFFFGFVLVNRLSFELFYSKILKRK